ncbi:hypothetical protein KI688_001177 [Linnemannia hyalina]|uniref:Uncharacterized protein n=1 Tax=Linnemannia hyalina TaxID=64524 RepID=A0A9P7Y5W4_9FUNG|nr:hypothetical protein KI688_001177 [Linnemannia hyalina]
MAVSIFGPTPNVLERTACKFVAELKVATGPVVSPEAFVDFVRGQLPTVRNKDVVWTWTSLRAYISEHGQDPLKVAFKNAALLTLDMVTRLWDATDDAEQEPEHKEDETKQQASKRKALQQPSRSPSNSICLSDRSGRGSSSSASRARDAMQKQYEGNLQAFKVKLWTVTSGTVVDMEIRSHVLSLMKESSLHSFVIDNAKAVIQLFTDKDKEEVAQVLEERGGEEQDTKGA